MPAGHLISRVTILGTGLIGGSFALGHVVDFISQSASGKLLFQNGRRSLLSKCN